MGYSEIVEGKARAMDPEAWSSEPYKAVCLCTKKPIYYDLDRSSVFYARRNESLVKAQAALDYLKAVPKPVEADSENPMSDTGQDLKAAWERLQPVWQPIVDTLRGEAP